METTPRSYTFGNVIFGDRARSLVQQAMDRNWVSAGPNVKLFEDLFRKTFGYQEAVAVSSGTAACFTVVAALHELGAEWGDEVIVPALSFVATSNAVLAAGFKPVFVDVKRETLNIDPDLIEAAITPKTRAIMAVHTMGKPCEMDTILDIAKRHKLHVLEDACEAHGAKYKGRVVGSIGLAGAFSFYAAHIICSGEGGMISTNDSEFASLLRSVRSHGRPDGSIYFQFDRFGFNTKMNDLEAALGIEGVENFQQIFSKRKENLNYLIKQTKEMSHLFYFLKEEEWELVSPHAFPLLIREDVPIDRDELQSYLEKNGVQVKTLFGSLPTQHKVFGFLGYKPGKFPQAEYIGKKGLHVGCHPYLMKDDIDYFVDLLQSYIQKEVKGDSTHWIPLTNSEARESNSSGSI